MVALADFGQCLKYGAKGKKEFKSLKSIPLNKRSECGQKREGINCVRC